MFILRWLLLVAIAICLAGVIAWTAWSLVAVRPPAPDDQVPDQLGPVPAPLPVVEPVFASLSEPPIDGGSIQWDAVLTLARLSEIAYSNADDQIKQAKELGAIVVQPLANNSSEGFVASDDRSVVIAFRGTQGIRDLVTDILGFPQFVDGGATHHGFSRAIRSVYQSAIGAAEAQSARSKTVWITGHSLGGAIACGFSRDAAKRETLRIDGIVTFGQPLVMSHSLCQFMIDSFGDRYLRVVNGVDPITTLVKLYRHAGARAQLFDDGEFDWQPPSIATMNPPPGTPMPLEGETEVVELNPDLRLISLEEAMELDRRIKAAVDAAPPAAPMAPHAVGSFFSNPVADHYMSGYLSRLRDIARNKATKAAVSD